MAFPCVWAWSQCCTYSRPGARKVFDLTSAIMCAVQVATWIKRQFALKPAIARIRRERAAQRPVQTAQIDNMY